MTFWPIIYIATSAAWSYERGCGTFDLDSRLRSLLA